MLRYSLFLLIWALMLVLTVPPEYAEAQRSKRGSKERTTQRSSRSSSSKRSVQKNRRESSKSTRSSRSSRPEARSKATTSRSSRGTQTTRRTTTRRSSESTRRQSEVSRRSRNSNRGRSDETRSSNTRSKNQIFSAGNDRTDRRRDRGRSDNARGNDEVTKRTTPVRVFGNNNDRSRRDRDYRDKDRRDDRDRRDRRDRNYRDDDRRDDRDRRRRGYRDNDRKNNGDRRRRGYRDRDNRYDYNRRNRYDYRRKYGKRYPSKRYYPKYRYHYQRRRYYRHSRPVIGFYIHIPSYSYYHGNYRRGYTSHFVYKQRIKTQAGYGNQYRNSVLDVRTHLRKKVRYVSGDRVKIEFRIERIEIWDGNYILGEIRHVPSSLGRTEAILYPDGYVEFDRMSYLVGSPESGFELISTRYYGDNLLTAYERTHGFRVGILDFYRSRVNKVRYSRLFDPYNFSGLVPISLIPDDDYWGFQYAAGGYQHNDDYYYGNYDYYGDDYYDDNGYFHRESYGYNNGYNSNNGVGSTASPQFHETPSALPRVGLTNDARQFSNKGIQEYQTKQGNAVRVEREVELQLKDSSK